MIGLLGGSFDPIHFGHLRLALEIQQGLELREVRLIPSSLPPHRTAPHAGAAERLAMVLAAIAGEPGLSVDERELRRDGPSYTVDTLKSLRAEFGDMPLCLILAMDAFLGLDSWSRWREIIGLAHIVVAQRPGWNSSLVAEVAALLTERRADNRAALMGQPAGRILTWPVTQLAISSTQIRDLLCKGQSPRYLLPDAVLEVINTNRIYSRIDTGEVESERV